MLHWNVHPSHSKEPNSWTSAATFNAIKRWTFRQILMNLRRTAALSIKNLMPSSPEYRGHFKVGFVDIESPQVSHVKAGLLTRIYYPSNEVATPKRMGNWLPNNWLYSKGYGGFIGISTWLISLVIYPVLCLTRTPALPHLKIAGKDKFPVVFFSHGLGGMRTTYSQTLGNLASRGFIVVAMEHADGSACITARNLKEIEYYRPLKEHLDDPDFQYLTIKRREQIEQRTDETVQTFAFIKELNSGKAEVLDSIGKDFLPQLIGKFDFDNAVMIGHSFGAATSINVCSSTDLDFKCCVLLDPWMFSVKENSVISIPALNIQSNASLFLNIF